MRIESKHAAGLGLAVLGFLVMIAGAIWWLLSNQFSGVVQGMLAGGAIAILVGIILAIDLLTQLVKTRQARFGAEALVITLGVIAIVGMLNFVFAQDDFSYEFDSTEGQVNTLTAQTVEIVSTLSQPVRAVAFYGSNQVAARERAVELFDRYVRSSDGNFSYVVYDPNLQPGLAQQYNITSLGQVVVEMGERREAVTFISEDELTSAIFRLNNQDSVAIYYTTGHQERSLSDTGDAGLSDWAANIQRQGYSLNPVNLLADGIPDDARLILVVGPNVPFFEDEVAILREFLDAGGSLVYFAEPSLVTGREQGAIDPLEVYLAEEWFITINDDLAVDYVLSLQGNPLAPVALQYAPSVITDRIQGLYSLFAGVRSIGIDYENVPGNFLVQELVVGSANAWGETNIASITETFSPVFDEGEDFPGPLNYAVLAEDRDTRARIVIVGDADFASNFIVRDPNLGNADLALNIVKWAAVVDSQIIITREPTAQRTFQLVTAMDSLFVVLLSLCVPLVIIIGAGVAVWWARRERPYVEPEG